MIAAFITDKMTAYIAGGMKPEVAAQSARGELLAIYKGNHWSRDAAGKSRKTPPPETLDIETAMKKADAAITEILKCHAETATQEKPRTYQGSAAIKHAVAAGIGVKPFFAKSGDNDPAAYTTDLRQIAALWNVYDKSQAIFWKITLFFSFSKKRWY